MLVQIPTDAIGIIFLILAILLLWAFNFLSVRWVESKLLAQRKKTQTFIVALLGVLEFLVILWIWGAITGIFSNWIPSIPWPNPQYLLILGPIIVFLVYIVLVHWLIEANWKNSTIISLVALLLLAFFLTMVPYVGEYLNFGIF